MGEVISGFTKITTKYYKCDLCGKLLRKHRLGLHDCKCGNPTKGRVRKAGVLSAKQIEFFANQ